MIYQKFLLYIFIVGQSYRNAKAISDELKDFQKSFEEAKDELQGIKNTLGIEEDENVQRQRRRTIDELLANFQQDPNMFEDFEDGEDWYREFRAREAAQNGRSDDDWEAFKLADNDNSADLIAADNNLAIDDANTYNNFNGLNYNYNNYKNDEAQHDFNDNYNYFNADGSNFNVNDILGNSFKIADIGKRSSNDIKRSSRSGLQYLLQKSNYNRNNYPNVNNNDYLKDLIDSRTTFDNMKERQRSSSSLRDGEYFNSNELNSPITYEQTIENINFPSINNDQFDINKNDLSHEANYKLSKIEQDAAEKDKDKEYPLCNEEQTTNGKKVLTDGSGASGGNGTSGSGSLGSGGVGSGSGGVGGGGAGSGSSSGGSGSSSTGGSNGNGGSDSSEATTCEPDPSATDLPPCTEIIVSSTESSNGMDLSGGSACGPGTSGSGTSGSGTSGTGTNGSSTNGSSGGSSGGSSTSGSNGGSGSSGSIGGYGSNGNSSSSSGSSGSSSSGSSSSGSGSGSASSGSSSGSSSSSSSSSGSGGNELTVPSIEPPVCKPPPLGSKNQFNFKIQNTNKQQYGSKQQLPTSGDSYPGSSSNGRPSNKSSSTSSNGNGKSKVKCRPKPSRKSWKGTDLTKRSYNFNPMNEIKLKTSRRLMRKGFGASLPSYSLVDTQRELKLDELMQRMENGEKNNVDERKTDVFSKLDALMNGNAKSYENRGNSDAGGYPYGDRINRMTDLRIGMLNNVGDENDANEIDGGPYLDDGADYTRIKRITTDEMNPKFIESMMQQNEAEEEASSRTKRAATEKPPNVCSTKLNAAGKQVPAACIGPQKTKITIALKELGVDVSDDDEKKTKEKICMKPNSSHSHPEKQDNQRTLRKRSALLADIERPKGTQTKTRHHLMPNEWQGSVGSNKQLFRSKRFTRLEDEIFNEDAAEDNETGDHDAHIRVKRALLEDAADQNNTSTTNSTNYQTTISSISPNSNLTETKTNSTESHKMQKRDTYMVDSYLDGNNDNHPAISSEHNVVVREDDYDDIAARRKRLIEKNFDFGAAMRPFGNEKFDNLQQKDPVDKLLCSKFDNDWYADEVQPSNTINTANSPSSVSPVSTVNSINAVNTANTVNSVNPTANHNSKRFKEKDQKSTVKKNYEFHPKETKTNTNDKKTLKGATTDKHANEVSISTSEAKDADRKLVLSLRDEILNSSAFTQLENLLKNYKRISDNSDANSGNIAKSDHNAAVAPDNNNNNNITCEEKSFTLKAPSPSGDTIAIEGSAAKKDDRMKLNITINASVMGDEKTNNFVGNGTINVRPGFAEDRERRSSMFPEFDFYDSIEKRNSKQGRSKAFKDKRKKEKCRSKDRDKERERQKQKEREKQKEKENCKNDEEECSLDNIINGKVSSDVVRNAFGLVRKNSKLKVLWPSLQRNKPAQKPPKKTDKKQQLSALRAHESDAAVQRMEEMMQQVMKCINGLIEKQLRSKSCLPLPPDLAEFYELILKTYEAQEKKRKKRENKTRSLATDFSKAVRAIDPNLIEEKSRIVKKLLRQYDELPLEDQKQATNMRDDLLLDLVYLRKVKTSQDMLEERRKRDVLEDQFNTQPIDEEIWSKFEKKYTPAFLKILKTADLFKETAADT